MSGGSFSGQSLSYAVDPLGRRRSRTGAGTTTRYLFAGAGEPHLYETDTVGTIENTDVDGADADLAHYAGRPTTGTAVTFAYYNGHGDLAAETNTTGTRTSAWSYDPFGQPRETLPTNKSVERYTGRWDKQHDTLSNLIQMGVRAYDPSLGRFYAIDPIEGGSLNNYDYALQDPINGFDLDGRMAIDRFSTYYGGSSVSGGGRAYATSAAVVAAATAALVAAIYLSQADDSHDRSDAGATGASGASGATGRAEPDNPYAGKSGEELKRIGEEILGRSHNPARAERWNKEFWSKLTRPQRRAYDRADGPRPRKKN
jgi:RHS repeat-associated protein